MNPETSSYIELGDDEVDLFHNPPYKLHLPLGEFISPNPNNVDSISIPKSPNSFFLYRKNFIAEHNSPGNKKDGKAFSKEAGASWENESDKVKSYFKVLAKVAFQNHIIAYENRKNHNHIFIPEQPGPQQNSIDNDNNDSMISSSHYPHSTCRYTNDNTTSSYQQLEMQQDNLHKNDNTDCAVSSPSSQYYSISSYIELQQKQKENNNDCAASSSLHPFSCRSDNTSSSHFMIQQLQQKDNFCKNNNSDGTVPSSLLHPHSSPPSSSSYFMVQQLEPQQKYNFCKSDNNDYAVSSSPYLHSTSFDFNINADRDDAFIDCSQFYDWNAYIVGSQF
nr:6503_t:CDS:1 [Entrophospora candida]